MFAEDKFISNLSKKLFTELFDGLAEDDDKYGADRSSNKVDNKHWSYSKANPSAWKHSNNIYDNPKPKVNKEPEEIVDLRWALYDLTDELIELIIKKRQDYGTSNIVNTPGGALNGLSIRLHDKVSRLNNLLSKDGEPNFESISDTFMDIANYAMIGLLYIDGEW